MAEMLRALVVEDSEDDAFIIADRLEEGGYELVWQRVDSAATMEAALENSQWDIIISDYRMPGFSGLAALYLMQKMGIDLPFLIVSGTIGEDIAVECMKSGAHDYIMKDNLTRLLPAVRRELNDAGVRKEKRAAQKALRESEERFRNAFEHAATGISLADLDGRPMKVNNALCLMLGYSEEELRAKLFGQITWPEDMEKERGLLQKLLSGEIQSFDMEKRYIHKDGRTVWGLLSVSLNRDNDGAPICFIKQAQDITQRKLAEEALRESEERWRSLVENAPDIILSIDHTGKILFINHTPVGFTVEEVTGASIYDFTIDPEQKKIVETAVHKVFETGEPQIFEVLATDPNRSAAYYSVTAGAINKDGRIEHAMLIGRDITEIKKTAEERSRLATAIEQADDAVMVTDVGGVIQYVNPAFEKLSGYSKEEAVGRQPSIVKSGKHNAVFYGKMWETITAGRTWRGQLINRRKGGGQYEVEASISPVFDSAGQITNFVAVSNDITQKSTLSKARDYFSAVTSHELRTPLTKLQLVKLLLRRVTPQITDADTAGRIHMALDEAVTDFNRIVSATTLFSDLVQGRTKQFFYQTDLWLILRYSVEFAGEMMKKEERKVTLDLSIYDKEGARKILCDQNVVQKVIDEVISNAIKYTPDGGTVKIEGKVDERNAIIRVTDQGIGIPLEKKELVFEPFFSLEDHEKHSTGRYQYLGGGIGMGLTIARLSMEYHDGKLEVESEGKDKGTVVTLLFAL